MDSHKKAADLYLKAGIKDVAEFYRQRYASEELLAARYFDPISRFDIRWARTMWVFDNVPRRSSILDIGCGAGILGLLKRKEVRLAGVDISQDCARVALKNGYDEAYAANLTALPFRDASFDYIISLDVMGHVEFRQKDAVLAEIRRVLRPHGVTLHGIECMDREKRKDYDQMTEAELSQFIQIDGHVGMESEEQIRTRFARFFTYVQAQSRFSICQSVEEFLKQAVEYSTELCDSDLLDYLQGLSFNERRSFNMAMGYVFEKISQHNIRLPKSEYLFLKASNTPLPNFYNAHRDRNDLFPVEDRLMEGPLGMDQSSGASFSAGWYQVECLPPLARWMGKQANIRFKTASLTNLRLDLTCHMPNLTEWPLHLEFLVNGETISSLSLKQNGWTRVELDIPSRFKLIGEYLFEIRADRTWQPCSTEPDSNDDRDLSIAVCNIETSP